MQNTQILTADTTDSLPHKKPNLYSAPKHGYSKISTMLIFLGLVVASALTVLLLKGSAS